MEISGCELTAGELELLTGTRTAADVAGERRVAFHLADDDSGVFYGWSDGTTWNGWDNVTVSRAERDRIVATLTNLWRAETRNGSVGFYALEDALSGIDELPVMPNGRVDLGWGYCTQIIGAAAEIETYGPDFPVATDFSDGEVSA